MPVISRAQFISDIQALFVVNTQGDIEADEVLARLTDLADSNPFDPAGGLFVPLSATTPFADNAARDTWAAANLGDLIQNRTLVEVAGTPNVWYLWTGATNPPTYDNTQWTDVTPIVRGNPGPQGVPGQGVNFANTTADTLLRTNAANDAIVNASITELAAAIDSTKMLQVPDAEGVMFGATQVTNAGFNIAATTADGRLFFPISSELETAGSARPNWIKAAALTTTPSPSNTSETFTGPNIQFRIINANTGFAQRYTLNAAAVATDCNFVFRLGSHTGEAIFDYKRATGGTGFDLSVGVNQIDLPLIRSSPDVRLLLFFRAGVELYVTIEPGSGNISLLGQTINVGGTNETVPFIETFGRLSEDVSMLTNDAGEITALTEKTTPVSADKLIIEDSEDSDAKKFIQVGSVTAELTILDEGAPLTTAATSIDFVGNGVTATGTGAGKTVTVPGLTVQDEASPLTTTATTLNFAGAGVTATGTGTTKTITIPGGGGGAALTIEDEGVALTTAAETLNFTGAGVTATGTGTEKTINIPGGGAGVTVQDEGVALTTIGTTFNFVGTGVTATGTGAVKTISIPGAAGASIPSLHNFTINIPSRVDIGTNLNDQRTVSFDVSNYSLLTALSLIVTDGDDQTLTVPIRDGVQTQTVTLSGINTGAATTVTFQLSGTYSGGTVTSEIQTVTVANLQAQEQAYVGSRLTNDFATVDVATLNAFDVTTAGTVYTFTQSVNNGEFLGILSPTNRDPVSVVNTTLSIDDLSRFTATANVRTIGGLSYNLLILQNNSGFNATFSYRVTTE